MTIGYDGDEVDPEVVNYAGFRGLITAGRVSEALEMYRQHPDLITEVGFLDLARHYHAIWCATDREHANRFLHSAVEVQREQRRVAHTQDALLRLLKATLEARVQERPDTITLPDPGQPPAAPRTEK